MLELKQLRKAWPDFELDVSLALGSGEVAAILGPSGSGKSTLLRVVAGLERPDSGAVLVRGRDVSALPPERRGIGMVFQDFALFPQMSVRRNIEYGPRMAGLKRGERERTALRMAEAFEIEALLDRGPSTLSGGEQQRVALARALAAEPATLLLDEPLSSLDAALRRRLRVEIGRSLRRSGKTALVVTHDAQEAFAIADRIFVMGAGKIVESGTATQIYESPASAFTARLLGEGPVLPCRALRAVGDRIIASTGAGEFLCDPPRGALSAPAALDQDALRETWAVFFPSEAAVLERPGEAAGSSALGRIEGRLLSATYEGRCLGATIECPGSGGETTRLELEIPLGLSFAEGDALSFRVPAGRAVLVAEGSRARS